jgi:hypothetical protein
VSASADTLKADKMSELFGLEEEGIVEAVTDLCYVDGRQFHSAGIRTEYQHDERRSCVWMMSFVEVERNRDQQR